ncbi:MAG: hypothetical protein KC613_18760, partial [Myxococcales bacterium]|nr:hypothetical protein [Myxococcales bacterium]
MHRRLALAATALGLLLAPAACEVPPLFGNECVSDSDCEGAGRCVSDTCVPACYIDADCADAGVGAVCQFSRCLVPVTVADASADQAVSDMTVGDQAV